MCCLQAWDLGKQLMSSSLKVWGLRGWWCQSLSEFQSPRTRSTDVGGQEGMDVSVHVSAHSPFVCLWLLSGPTVDWVMSTHVGEGHLYCLSIQTLTSSGNALPAHPETMFYQQPGHPWAQSGWQVNITSSPLVYYTPIPISLSHTPSPNKDNKVIIPPNMIQLSYL